MSPLKFANSNFWIISGLSVGFVLWFGIFRLILYRLRDDMSNLATTLSAAAHGGDLLVRAIAFTTFFGWAGGTYLCLATTTALPLQDATLAWLDQMLHFDWIAFLTLTNSNPIVSRTLVVAYHSAFPQMVLLYILLSFSRREEQLAELLTLFCVTFGATCFLMLLVPAAGAYPYYQPRRELFDGFSADAGMWHYEVFNLLRTAPSPVLKLEYMKGLVTFPSFHTALAIITAYAARDIPFIALPAAILNGIVIVSTLPEGGHFLVDVLAGAIIALVGIALARWKHSAWIVKCRSSYRTDLVQPTSRA
jgi:membrane-associated phospholipid phosphatase